MGYLLFTVHLVGVGILCGLARSTLHGPFTGSLVHPNIVFAIVSTFFSLEFLHLWQLPDLVDIANANITASQSDIAGCYLYYDFMFAAAVIGITLANITSHRSKSSGCPGALPATLNELRISRWFMAIGLVSCVPGAAVLFAHLGELLAGETTFQIFMRESWLFAGAISVILPCFVIFLSVRKPWSPVAVIVSIIVLSILFLSGTRSNVIICVIVILVAAVANGVRLSALWIIPAVPVVAIFLASSRYFLREGWNEFSSYADFVDSSGGYASLFFDSGEIGMAKAFSNVVLLQDQLSWDPFSTLLGMVMFPLPRAYFTFKPAGASAYFTEELAPMRWLLTKSELTITGYGDLLLSFGAIGAVIVIFLLAFLWQRVCVWAVNGTVARSVIWLPFLISFDFLFVRTDFYNIAAFIWPFALVLGAYKLVLLATQSYDYRRQETLRSPREPDRAVFSPEDGV